MSRLQSEPFVMIESLEELFAVAAAMEQEAIDGYVELAQRMHRENQPALAEVFEQLVAEEMMHLENVGHWSQRLIGKGPDLSALRWEPEALFDDEGAGSIAPELLSSYRAFSTAVRNEERAFAFWTYVASQSPSAELRRAAEQMAREELDHVARLRRERRRAFHENRVVMSTSEEWTLPGLENRLATLLDTAAQVERPAPHLQQLADLALAARNRANALTDAELGDTALLRSVTTEASARLRPLTELLLDSYLDLGERLPSQSGRERAQLYAAELLDCLTFVRQLCVA